MVAYDSRRTPDPAHSLSPEAIEQLTRALRAQPVDRGADANPDVESATDADLSAALASVAVEARDRGLRPEELIIAIKQLEDLLAPPDSAVRAAERRRTREWIVSTCLRAWFGS